MTKIDRRQFTAGSAAGLASATIGSQRADAQAYGSNELIEAAKKEGKFVYYTADFTEPHIVANGASEVFVQLFGERGLHARTAM